MTYFPFEIESSFALRDQINFFCSHEDRMGAVDYTFNLLNQVFSLNTAAITSPALGYYKRKKTLKLRRTCLVRKTVFPN